VNASPLIFLSKVGLLEVHRDEGVPVVVPDVVRAEVGALGPNDPSDQAVQAAGWLQVMPVPAPSAVLPTSLDAGEAAVLTLAMAQADSRAVLDDLAARRFAQQRGIPLQGTLGPLIVARRIGMIAQVRPVIERLRADGLFVRFRPSGPSGPGRRGRVNVPWKRGSVCPSFNLHPSFSLQFPSHSGACPAALARSP
jgi:predicted nucleic acid-binding protein